MSRQIELLQARRFQPLFLTQILGAFNDNLFKSAFVMLITYGAAAALDPGVVAAIAGAALIAPFFLVLGDSRRACGPLRAVPVAANPQGPPNSSRCLAPRRPC